MNKYSKNINRIHSKSDLLLDSNERLTPVSKKIKSALISFINSDKLIFYPEYEELYPELAKYVAVAPDNLLLTNGSDQAIDLIIRTFTNRNDKIIIPKPSFVMYWQYAELAERNIVTVDYDAKNYSFPTKNILKLLSKQTKLIIICNPNNPTGTLVDLADIEIIAKKAKQAIVYIDEAYFEFSKLTAVSLIKKYPNIVISRTFSKAFGLPSLRLGYIIANRAQIQRLKNTQGPYDVNALACVAAKAALSDLKSMDTYVREVMTKAKPRLEAFLKINGISYLPSAANFVFIKTKKAQKIFNTMQQQGILLRSFKNKSLKNNLRITIGTDKQVEQFIAAYNAQTKPNKYAFFDRDGTLIHEPQDTFQIDSLKKLKILDGVIDTLIQLKNWGYKFVMVSNQNGIGTPSFPENKFRQPQQRLLSLLSQQGIQFEQVFICPHLPEDNCYCRKPKTGLVDEFLKNNRRSIDLKNSFLCGDRETDQQFAKNIGMRFIRTPTNSELSHILEKL